MLWWHWTFVQGKGNNIFFCFAWDQVQLLLFISSSVRGRTSQAGGVQILAQCEGRAEIHGLAGAELRDAWSCVICVLCITVKISLPLSRVPCPLLIPWLSSYCLTFFTRKILQLISRCLCWLFSQQIKQTTSVGGVLKVLLSRMDTLSSALPGTAWITQQQTCLGLISFSQLQ